VTERRINNKDRGEKMKYKNFVYISAIVMSTLLTFSAGKSTAQTTANGPYYAWPSWDQQLPASTRFIVLSNWKDANFPSGGAAVLDRETGLVWEKSPDTNTRQWLSAHGFCNSRSVGGRKGWRLPTIQELASLVDPSVLFPGPTLPAGHPFTNVQSSASVFYWSATTSGVNTSNAWGLRFSDGALFTLFDKSSSVGFVWCVRGGQGVDPQ
jgi:hypothetical protein